MSEQPAEKLARVAIARRRTPAKLAVEAGYPLRDLALERSRKLQRALLVRRVLHRREDTSEDSRVARAKEARANAR